MTKKVVKCLYQKKAIWKGAFFTTASGEKNILEINQASELLSAKDNNWQFSKTGENQFPQKNKWITKSKRLK